MDLNTISFLIIAGISILFALGVVLLENIVHSALSLIVTFLGMAGIFLLLNADFLGLVQVLAYGGAVAVLIIFAVMLVQNSDNKKNSSGFTRLSPIAFFATILLLILINSLIFYSKWNILETTIITNSAEKIAHLMFSDFAIPFEAAAVLLLVALIGAILVGKGADKEE